MTIKEALSALTQKFSKIDDGNIEAKYILEKVIGISYGDMLLRYNDSISEEKFARAESMAERRLLGEPIQYILGDWDFMDFTFKVGEGVLIPRPETEILVEQVLENIRNVTNPVVYDLCAGSGCIGLSVKKLRPDAKVYLVEKSDNAFIYLQSNYENLCGDLGNTTVLQGDILHVDSFDYLPDADVIISNPPYIRSGEIASLQSEVLREPHMALDGGEDGLIFYRCLVNEWSPKLKEGGFMAFECGEDQAEDICHLFEKINFDNQIINDYNNIQRIVIGKEKLDDF